MSGRKVERDGPSKFGWCADGFHEACRRFFVWQGIERRCGCRAEGCECAT